MFLLSEPYTQQREVHWLSVREMSLMIWYLHVELWVLPKSHGPNSTLLFEKYWSLQIWTLRGPGQLLVIILNKLSNTLHMQKSISEFLVRLLSIILIYESYKACLFLPDNPCCGHYREKSVWDLWHLWGFLQLSAISTNVELTEVEEME